MNRQRRTVMELLDLAAGYLAERGIDSARLDAEVLLGHTLGLDRVSLYVNFDRPLENREVDTYRQAIAQRGRRVPVAQITGVREFYSQKFVVSSDVLVPRPETELLVEVVLAHVQSQSDFEAIEHSLKIVDVGTGSGAIAVTLADQLPKAQVWAVDRSQAALRIAADNAERLDVAERVTLREGSWLEPVAADGPFDVVVSNPPYIPSADIDHLMPEVKQFEPRLALDGGADGLSSYRALLPVARGLVAPGGMLALEVGDGQADHVVAIGQQAGWQQFKVHRDMAGKKRVVVFVQAPSASFGTGSDAS